MISRRCRVPCPAKDENVLAKSAESLLKTLRVVFMLGEQDRLVAHLACQLGALATPNANGPW